MENTKTPRLVSLKTTLRVVNRIRKALDMKPLDVLPKGTPEGFNCCPLAKALKAKVSLEWIEFGSMKRANVVARLIRKGRCGHQVTIPKTFQRFVRQFDSGKFPQLEA